MARGWRGAGILTGVGQAGNALLQVALAKRGFDLREKQMGQQQEQFKQMMGVRERMASAYEDKAIRRRMGQPDPDYFGDLADYLDMEPDIDVRAGVQGYRQRALIPSEARAEAAPVVAETAVAPSRSGAGLFADLDERTRGQPQTWKRWIPNY